MEAGWLTIGGLNRRLEEKAARRGCKPEPPNILTENITDEVSDLYANPTRFSVQILP